MVHSRDWAENFQNSLIECTEKVAFQASDSSLKPSCPLFSVLKTDQEISYPLEVDLGDFYFFQNSPISPSSPSSCFARLQPEGSRYQHEHLAYFKNIPTQVCMCCVKKFAL